MLIERVCEECGTSFRIYPSRLHSKSPVRFCSSKCYGIWQRGRETSCRKLPIRQELGQQYQGGESASSIATRYGVRLQTVTGQLERAGVKRRPPSGANLRLPEVVAKAKANIPKGSSHYNFRAIPIDDLIAAYIEGRSSVALALDYGVAPITIARKLREAGIALRSPGFSRYRIAKDGHKVQSYWESQVDDWLSEHGLSHICQPMLPFGHRNRADFLVGETYIEVWGITHNASYAARKKAKLSSYQKASLAVIEVWPPDIARGTFASLHALLR